MRWESAKGIIRVNSPFGIVCSRSSDRQGRQFSKSHDSSISLNMLRVPGNCFYRFTFYHYTTLGQLWAIPPPAHETRSIRSEQFLGCEGSDNLLGQTSALIQAAIKQ